MQSQATPERSLQQRMDALKGANEIRSRRGQLKRDLKAGRLRIVDLIADPPEWLLTAKVIDLLVELPKFGPVKATHAMNAGRVSLSKTFGGLTDRQRGVLVDRFAGR